MIQRFYADNFRCLVNFELKLDELNVFLGSNGTGKSSVFDVLLKIQSLVYRGRKVDEGFPAKGPITALRRQPPGQRRRPRGWWRAAED